MTKLLLETNRSGYSTDQITETLTVGDLIGILEDYDEETPVYFSNDGGYTYGGLWWNTIQEEEDEDPEEY